VYKKAQTKLMYYLLKNIKKVQFYPIKIIVKYLTNENK